MTTVTKAELQEFADNANISINNHILQLRDMTERVKALNEAVIRINHVSTVRKAHINLFRNLAVQLQQHLVHPRERNVPILIRAIEHALNTTETKGD